MSIEQPVNQSMVSVAERVLICGLLCRWIGRAETAKDCKLDKPIQGQWRDVQVLPSLCPVVKSRYSRDSRSTRTTRALSAAKYKIKRSMSWLVTHDKRWYLFVHNENCRFPGHTCVSILCNQSVLLRFPLSFLFYFASTLTPVNPEFATPKKITTVSSQSVS